MNKLNKRDLLKYSTMLALSISLPATALAQKKFPSRTIKILVLSPPGSNGDIMARILAKNLAEELKGSVIVENKPGAGGHLSHEAVARSTPDGHTILFGANNVFTLSPIMYKNLSYDPFNDLKPAAFFYEGTHLLLTNSKSNINNFKEFVEYAKTNGKNVNYGSAGTGHPLHFYSEHVQQGLGLEMTHVAYNGMPNAIQGLIKDEVKFLVTGISDTIEHVKSGSLKVLATTGPRFKELDSQVGFHLEDEFPALAYDGWVGIYVPSQTPDHIVEVFNQAMNNIAKKDSYLKELSIGGNVPIVGSHLEAKQRLQKDTQKTMDLAKNIKLG